MAAAFEEPITVLVSGAAGQIGYSLIPLICTGQMFGANQPVNLRLLEVSFDAVKQRLEGCIMELNDCAYPLVREVRGCFTDEPEAAWTDIDYAVLVGGFPRKAGMVRADLLKKNAGIFKQAGECLEAYAKETTKVLVVANPANTNCFVCSQFAPKIPKENFCALTRLDFNRSKGLLAGKLGVSADCIKNMVIWGNHSKSQVPDASFATVNGATLVQESVKDDEWLFGNEEGQFMHTVQYRGASVIKARGASSAMSAANAACNNVRDWFAGTPAQETVAMSVWSTGNPYGIADDLFYSFPCTVDGSGQWTIAGGYEPNERMMELMKKSEEELMTEKQTCMDYLAEQAQQ